MEFSIGVDELQYVVKLFGKIAKRNTEDPTGQINIEITKEGVKFLSNNSSIVIEYVSKQCNIKEQGNASVVFNKLFSFVTPFTFWNGSFGSKEVLIKSTDKAVYVSIDVTFEDGSFSKNKIKLELHNPFGVLKPDVFGQSTFTMNSAIMRTAINKVIYAISPNEVRSAIQNMKIDFDEDCIRFVGTNGIQLSEYKVQNNTDYIGGFSVRYDFMSVLRVILPNDDTQLFIEISERKIRAKFGNVYIEGRMDLGHNYPEYRPTLEAFSNIMSLDKKIILSSITPIQEILDSDDYNRITVEVKDKKLQIYSDTSHFIYSKDVDFDGEYIVDVNGQILKKTIESISDEELILKFSDSNGVLIFDSKSQSNQSSLMTPVRRRKK